MTDKTKKSSSSSTSVSVSPEVKEPDDVELDKWIDSIYQVNLVNDDELKFFYEQIQYQGFNRKNILKQLYSKVPDPRIVIQIVVAVAVRGPRIASQQKLGNGKTCVEMGIPSSGGKGSRTLTCNKIQAATADLAAFYLRRLNVPKRLNVACPSWLQFPSAASIKLPKDIREMHREFAQRFSTLIGGAFDENIYEQMEINSYVDLKLNLFA
jgi:hypothetical protein